MVGSRVIGRWPELRSFCMASPQKENGFTPIAHELLEAFYGCKMLEYERCVVMCIWRKTYGWQKKEDWVSNSQINEETGIALPNITRTIKSLLVKKILCKNGKKVTVNKNYEEWNVEWRRLSHQIIKIISPDKKKLSHQIPTIEKKENNTKETSKPSLQGKNNMENLIPEVIKLFESVDPKNKAYYANKTQRGACLFLLNEYGFDEVQKRVQVLNMTNGMQYFPNITTPCQLRDKWVQLDAQIKRHKQEINQNKNKVAF